MAITISITICGPRTTEFQSWDDTILVLCAEMLPDQRKDNTNTNQQYKHQPGKEGCVVKSKQNHYWQMYETNRCCTAGHWICNTWSARCVTRASWDWDCCGPYETGILVRDSIQARPGRGSSLLHLIPARTKPGSNLDRPQKVPTQKKVLVCGPGWRWILLHHHKIPQAHDGNHKMSWRKKMNSIFCVLRLDQCASNQESMEKTWKHWKPTEPGNPWNRVVRETWELWKPKKAEKKDHVNFNVNPERPEALKDT